MLLPLKERLGFCAVPDVGFYLMSELQQRLNARVAGEAPHHERRTLNIAPLLEDAFSKKSDPYSFCTEQLIRAGEGACRNMCEQWRRVARSQYTPHVVETEISTYADLPSCWEFGRRNLASVFSGL